MEDWTEVRLTEPHRKAQKRTAPAESTTSNGISGMKLHLYQLAELAKRIAAIEGGPGLICAEVMVKTFPNARPLWLTR